MALLPPDRFQPHRPMEREIIDDIPLDPLDPPGPGGPAGPRGPQVPGNPRTPVDDPLLEGRPYQDIMNDYNQCIGNIDRFNKQLYAHETAYNKGDYSFAGNNKSTAASVIQNDKDQLAKFEKKRKELESELKLAEQYDKVGANKNKSKLKTYESYDDYKKRMDNNQNEMDGIDRNGIKDGKTTKGEVKVEIIQLMGGDYAEEAEIEALIDKYAGNDGTFTLEEYTALKNDPKFKAFMEKNKLTLGTKNSDETSVINQDKKEYKLPSNQTELKDLLVGMGLATFNENTKQITFGFHVEADGKFHNGGFTNYSMDKFYEYYTKNKDQFDKCLDNYASGAGWTKTTGGSNTDPADSTGDPLSQAELEALKTELATLQGELGTLQGEKTTLEGNKETLEQEIADLKAKLAKAEANLTFTLNLIDQVGITHASYDTLVAQRTQMREDIEKYKNDIATKTANLSTIDAQISAKEAEITAKNAEINTKQGEVEHRETYLENNKDGSKMRFDEDYGIKNTSSDATDKDLENLLKDLTKNKKGVPNDNDVKKLIDILKKYGVSNAEAYVNKLLEGDGKITDAEIKNLLAGLKDKINANGKNKTYNTMLNEIFPSGNTPKSDTAALERKIKEMGLRETNCKGVYCEQHHQGLAANDWTHQVHYVWDPVKQDMIPLKDKNGNPLYYISADGHEAKDNDVLKNWKNGKYKGYGLVHTGMDGKVSSRYTA